LNSIQPFNDILLMVIYTVIANFLNLNIDADAVVVAQVVKSSATNSAESARWSIEHKKDVRTRLGYRKVN
jgi:hypothetical protein